MFALRQFFDAFLHVVTDGADGDLAAFVRCGLAIEGFHEIVGEEAVLLVAAFVGVLGSLGGAQDGRAAAPSQIDEHVLELLH